MTPILNAIHQRSVRFHQHIAVQAARVIHPIDRSYSIPNTPFGIPKFREPAPRERKTDPIASYHHCMWFYSLVFHVPMTGPTPLTVDTIQRKVCEHYGIKRVLLLSERRTAKVVRPRQVAMYLAKTLTVRSFPEIGRRFGNRDHTTVLHAVRKIEGLLKTDNELESKIALIRAELGA